MGRHRLTLHEAIRAVLSEAGSEGLPIPEVARRIRERGLYLQQSGENLSSQQVYARIHNYPDFFEVDRSSKPAVARLRAGTTIVLSGMSGPLTETEAESRGDEPSMPVLEGFSEGSLLKLYNAVMRELKARGMVRSFNNPVGDVGERAVSRVLGLQMVGRSAKGYDAVGGEGVRYQIKTRWRGARGWRNVMGLRDLDERLFDRLAVAILNRETYEIDWLFHFPHEVAAEYARETTRGFKRITLTEGFLRDPKVTWIIGGPWGRQRQ